MKVIAAEKDECFFVGKVNNCPGSKEKLSKCGRIQKIIDASKVQNHLDIHDLLEAGTVTHVFCHKKCVFTYISPQNLSHLSQKRKPQGESKPLSKRLCSEALDKTFHCFLAADGDLVAAEAQYHWKCSCLFHKHSESNDDRSHSEVDTALLKTFEMLEQNRTKIWK